MSRALTLALYALLALNLVAALTIRNPSEAYNPNHPNVRMFKRALTTNPADVAGKNYDFIIAGGGLAGLTLAGRLAEWSNFTVLVIEAGGDGSDVQIQEEVPGELAEQEQERAGVALMPRLRVHEGPLRRPLRLGLQNCQHDRLTQHGQKLPARQGPRRLGRDQRHVLVPWVFGRL